MPVPTKQNLAYALKTLIKTKPLQKITVKDITDFCSLNRMTFYYHFNDIYDLVKWVVKQIFTKDLNKDFLTRTWGQVFLDILKKLSEEKDFILKVISCVEFEDYESYVYDICLSITENYFNEDNCSIKISKEGKAYVSSLYRYMLVGVLTTWIASGMSESPELVIRKLTAAINGTFEQTCERYYISMEKEDF